MASIEDDSPFAVTAYDRPQSPVVIAVPHAGRVYPQALSQIARVSVEKLAALEDRFADMLIDDALRSGVAAVVATRARAWIDLNRDIRDLDPAMVTPPPDAGRLIHSAKMRAGLGLVPRRLPTIGDLWSRRLTAIELADRIDRTHTPYHAAIAFHLARAKAEFGQAVLIDCHSMPPLPAALVDRPARIVIGDRFGRSAADDLVDAAIVTSMASGLDVVRNVPYAGGYTLDRHGDPRHGMHAIQIEFDRSLYLDAGFDGVTPGLSLCRALLGRIVDRLAGMILQNATFPLAAE